MSEFNLVVPPSMAKTLGLEEGIILFRVAALVEFTSRNTERVKTNFIDGKWWYRASYKSWVDMFSGVFNQRKILRVFESLVKNGYLEKGIFNKQFSDRTAWYTLTEKTRTLLSGGVANVPAKEEDHDTKSGKLMLPEMATCHDTKNGNFSSIYYNIYNNSNKTPYPFLKGGQSASADESSVASEVTKETTESKEDGFEEFWKLYPKCSRKVGKAKCLEYWKRHNLCKIKDKVFSAIKRDSKKDDWTKQGGAFIPMPHTWFNRKTYLDEEVEVETERRYSVFTVDDAEIPGREEEWDAWYYGKTDVCPEWAAIKSWEWCKANGSKVIIGLKRL